jgi:NADP-reducing hydrogenase subunit HndB
MKSLQELQAIRDKVKANITLREDNANNYKVVVGMATCGIAAGARPVLTAFVEELAKRNINNIQVTQTGCIGICQYEPVVEIIDKDGSKTTYVKISPEKVASIVANHLVNGSVVDEYTIGKNTK